LAKFEAPASQTQVNVAQAQVQQTQVQVQVMQNQVQVTQVQVQAAQIGVQATQVKVEATQTVVRADLVATQTAEAADVSAQQVVQATRTEAVKIATVSQQVLRRPSPTFGSRTPEPTWVAAQTAAAAAAQILDFKVKDVKAEISPTVIATCPMNVNLQAVIAVNQPGTVTYRWERSDGASLLENSITFPVSGTKTVMDTWAINYLTAGWARLRILSPDAMQSNQARFTVRSSIPTPLQSALEKNPKVVSNLGCPQGSPSKTINGARQMFQNGLMLWREDDTRIYVLQGDSTWKDYRDTWEPSQKEGGFFKPPSGLYEPQRGFGKVWREQLGGDKAQIGWATDRQESAIKMQIQNFDHGFALIIDDGKDFKILFFDNKWADL